MNELATALEIIRKIPLDHLIAILGLAAVCLAGFTVYAILSVVRGQSKK